MVQLISDARARRPNGRRPRPRIEERHLSDELEWAHVVENLVGAVRPSCRRDERALDDQEERRARLPLFEDEVSALEAAYAQAHREHGSLVWLEGAEHVDVLGRFHLACLMNQQAVQAGFRHEAGANVSRKPFRGQDETWKKWSSWPHRFGVPPDEKAGTLVDDVDARETVHAESHTRPPSRQRRYVDDREIGHGGMGRVLRVRDTALLCDVAKKMLDPELEGDQGLVDRFIEEAQITSQLDHPNIVPVHELVTDRDGPAFFTMKLVRGVSLHEWLHDPARPVGSSERLSDGLDILLKVCDGISFAHARGVVHRDLKPANVMIGEFGEVYVMDWGLALVTGDSVRTTRPRTTRIERAVGTPAYMAPEAANGFSARCDERTDVFGLGAILYQIVTGQTPYHRLPELAVEAARRGEYRPPERFLAGASVSKRILGIIEKALATSPADRYQSAAELKADLRRFLRGGLYLPRQVFSAGAKIVAEGQVGHEAFVILRGTCEAYKTIRGERKFLRRMGAGEVFGETAVLCDQPRTATVEALDTVTALVVDRTALEEGLGLDSWLGALVRALATRFRELDAALHEEKRG